MPKKNVYIHNLDYYKKPFIRPLKTTKMDQKTFMIFLLPFFKKLRHTTGLPYNNMIAF